jgi:hypothetical protein
MDSLGLTLEFTLVEDLSELQVVSQLFLVMEGNINFDTLYIPENVLALDLFLEQTHLRYIHGGAKIKRGGTITIYDNDHLQMVDLDLGDMDDSYQGYPKLDVAQNDSLKTFYWGNPHGQLRAIDFFENRQLTHVHLQSVSEALSPISGSNGGFRFNIELDSISGCNGLESIFALNFKDNYKLNNACVFQKAIENRIQQNPNAQSMFTVQNNGPNLQSLNDLLNADCSWLPNGVAEVAIQEMALYPNPAHDEVFVEVPKTITNYRIYDMSGKTVKSGTVEASGRIGLHGISGGMYILQVNENRSKLVIQ